MKPIKNIFEETLRLHLEKLFYEGKGELFELDDYYKNIKSEYFHDVDTFEVRDICLLKNTRPSFLGIQDSLFTIEIGISEIDNVNAVYTVTGKHKGRRQTIVLIDK